MTLRKDTLSSERDACVTHLRSTRELLRERRPWGMFSPDPLLPFPTFLMLSPQYERSIPRTKADR